MLLLTTGTGAFALAVLLQLPGLPNCPAVFWPLAPASLRFECGRLAASKQTLKSLLEAIALVDSLPENHPLRGEADRMVENWSTDVLRLADDLFNQGQLNEAISAARKIPAKASSFKLVESRIRQWQQIWARGEKIYKQAEAAMRKLNWKEAFNLAVRLLDLENEYWRTTQYEELTQRITTAREDGNKFYEAERLADAGGVDNLLKAIKLADSIRSTSYVYDAAQKLIPKYGRRLIALAETALEQQDLQEALNIVNQIPEKANLEAEKQDFITLANAQASSWHSSVTDLESAIAQAQGIAKGRPLYSKAQRLMGRWQLEMQALTKLEKARVFAQGGSLNDLSQAIAEASQVASSNPRWPEVQQQIQAWTATIETTQDQPVLTQAEDLASQGDGSSLQAAIAQANQIGRGRALYPQAQDKIQQWTDSLQRVQDQPLLDQAQQYASAGNLTSAIATANRIASGRALYNSAQASIRTWRNQLQTEQLQAQAQQTLQEAYQLANTGSVLDMANAIQVASRVPSSSSLRSEADTAIDRWSQQLLDAARNQAGSDLPGAIGLAQRIPSRARIYGEAQSQIETWKQSQTPVMAPQ
ncbi:MAG: hypothetical protein ACKO24_06460 [Leptolyngbyaceae cyanobacterium]